MKPKPLSCDQELLRQSLHDSLSDEQESQLANHLSECPECQRELERLAAAGTELSRFQDILKQESERRRDSSAGGWHSTGVGCQLSGDGYLDSLADFAVDFLDPPETPQAVGRLGDIDIHSLIGHGSMGIVLKGFQWELNRPVAVKILMPHLASSGAARKRFAREAQATAVIVHPNVMPILTVNSSGKLPFLVMPYVTCESLQHRLDREGPLGTIDVLRIAVQVSSGLAAAHAQGLVHRDIKPANILLEKGVDRVMLTDFGLARAVDDATLTRTGVIAGTPQYMSPEQARGESIDARSDLFSLGSVLYTMCTGRPPFRAESSYGILRRITDAEPRAIRDINAEIPEWLVAIVEKLLAKRPDQRFTSAEDVAALLKQCLAHTQQPTVEPLPDVVSSLVGRASPREGRKPVLVPRRIALFAAGVVTMAAIICLAIMGRPDREKADTEQPSGSAETTSQLSSPAPSPSGGGLGEGDKVASTQPRTTFQAGVHRNWHRFRGPGGSGVSSHNNVPTAWDATSDAGIVWRTQVPLPGKNSPIVWEGRVFLSGANQTEQQVYCFDAVSGKLVWERDVPTEPPPRSAGPKVLETTGYAAPSLTTDGKRVFAIFASGDVAAIPFSGDAMWIRRLGTLDNVYGHASSPVVYRNLLLIQLDQGSSAKKEKSRLLALDVTTGETVYERRRPVPNSWSTPVLIKEGPSDQLVTCANPWVIAYDPSDGTEIWRAKCLGGDIGPSPIFAEGIVYVGNEFPQLTAIRADGRGDVTESHIRWTAEIGLPDTCSPLAADGYLFLLASWGMLSCYDATTGDLLWENEFDGSFTASPAWANGRVYVISENGKGWVVEPKRDRGVIVAQTNSAEKCFASPAFQDGHIYIRGDEHLLCIGHADQELASKGHNTDERDAGATVSPTMADAPTTEFVTSDNSTLSQFQGDWPGFRGVNRDAISLDETKLARSWPPEGPPVLWSIDLGQGYAGAAVCGDRVYVLDYDEQRGADTARCFSLDDGHEIWKNSYPVLLAPNHGMTRTVPAVIADRVITMGPRCHLACWDAESGECYWIIDLVREHGATVPTWYTGQCPLVDRERIIVAPCGEALMIAIDCETGKVIWESDNPRGWNMTHRSIVPMDFDGRRSYVYGASSGVVGIAADNGSILWESTDWSKEFANCPSPVVLPGGRIFLSRGYGRNVGSLMLQLEKSHGRVVAETLFELSPRQFGSEIHTPIFRDGHLYGVRKRRGQMVCLDVKGNEVWNSGGDRFGLGPYLFADGLLLALQEDGALTLAEASPAGYKRLAQHAVIPDGEDAWSPMAIAGGRLILRDLSRMVCLDLRKK